MEGDSHAQDQPDSKRKKCHAATPSCWTLHGAAAGDAKFILARNAFDSGYWFFRRYWIGYGFDFVENKSMHLWILICK